MIDIKWLDTEAGTIGKRNDRLDYGYIHCDDEGLPMSGFHQFEYIGQQSTVEKIPYIIKYGLFKRSETDYNDDNCFSWEPPDDNIFLDCLIGLRKFMNAKDEEKISILTNQLGFDEVGLCVGDDLITSKLFTYKFTTEPSQIELWLDQNGTISELNRFHNEKFEEIKIPVSIEGVHYVFMQIFADTYKVNFNKYKPDETIKIITKALFDLKITIPEIDFANG